MARFRGGDDAGFDAVFHRYAAMVQGFLLRMVNEPELARDLLQHTFLALAQARERYVPGRPVRPWVFTIAANAARDALRHRQQVERHAQLEATAGAERAAPEPPDPLLQKRLLQAFEALSKAQRDAVVQRELEGRSYGAIARAAGITEAAARIRAHRGAARLRGWLADCRG